MFLPDEYIKLTSPNLPKTEKSPLLIFDISKASEMYKLKQFLDKYPQTQNLKDYVVNKMLNAEDNKISINPKEIELITSKK